MNITRLLTVTLLGMFAFCVFCESAQARRPNQNTVVITPPPPPQSTPDVSPK